MKVVLGYSGGLDTSVIVPWLKENYGAEVVCMAGDVGQQGGLEGLEKKALETGASEFFGEDLRSGSSSRTSPGPRSRSARSTGKYLLGTAIARPLLARRQVEVAREVDADAVAHGCTGKGNDQVRFELAYAALAPDLEVIVPVAGVGHPVAGGRARVRPRARHPARGRRPDQALLAGREPLAHLARGRSARGPRVRGRGVDVPVDRGTRGRPTSPSTSRWDSRPASRSPSTVRRSVASSC